MKKQKPSEDDYRLNDTPKERELAHGPGQVTPFKPGEKDFDPKPPPPRKPPSE